MAIIKQYGYCFIAQYIMANILFVTCMTNITFGLLSMNHSSCPVYGINLQYLKYLNTCYIYQG